MKRITLMTLIFCIICIGAFSQESLYVSAKGDDNNSGLSEAEPLKSLSKAFSLIRENDIKKMTVIGTLDINSEVQNRDVVFMISGNTSSEILITGKPNAKGAEKAVLSAKKSNKSPVSINNSAKIRFEHIEISGGEGIGVGMFVLSNAQVTLGHGAVVRENSKFGILISDNGICTIDGGEVRNNKGSGVFIQGSSVLYMKNGTITSNNAEMAAGVFAGKDSRFEMSGGSITRNRASSVIGGVLIQANCTFIQTGGTIRQNSAAKMNIDVNLYIEK